MGNSCISNKDDYCGEYEYETLQIKYNNLVKKYNNLIDDYTIKFCNNNIINDYILLCKDYNRLVKNMQNDSESDYVMLK